MKNAIKSTILISLIFALSFMSFGQLFDSDSAVKPLIEVKPDTSSGLILFSFTLKPDNHITDLKNGFFKIEAKKNDFLEIKGTTFPPGESYGDEAVFKGDFTVKVYLSIKKNIPSTGIKAIFKVSYQVCQEKPNEVCFPPESEEIEVTVPGDFREVTGSVSKNNINKKNGSKDEDFSSWILNTVQRELKKKSVLLFLLIFLAGFLTSFTPCVYPVIPIVMGYVGTRSGRSKFKGLYLSLFFVLGLALVYSVLGVIAAMTGSMMGLTFQNPLVVTIIALIFIVMGLSLAGFFEIPVPSSISSKVRHGHKSEIIGALTVGGVSGIIAAPCVGPVLIALLSYISQTGDIFLGFWMTFVFSIGLGVIFLIAGTFSGAISSMPKGGKWMDYFKYFFSVLLIGGGLYFLSLITSTEVSNMSWGVFLIGVSVFSGLFKPIESDNLKSKLFKLILVLLVVSGSFIFMRGFDALFLRSNVNTAKVNGVQKNEPAWIYNLNEGRIIASSQNRILMADSYADWCVACKELDEYTFSNPEVMALLKEIVTVKLDFTESSDKNKKIRDELKIIGMPTVIFFRNNGDEIDRFSGFMKKDKFIRFLKERIFPNK